MKYENFRQDLLDLHTKMVKAIADLMKEHNVTEVDLLGSDASHAFVAGFEADDVVELEVNKVYLNDKGEVILDVIKETEKEDEPDEYFMLPAMDYAHIMMCGGMHWVYESVREALEEEN